MQEVTARRSILPSAVRRSRMTVQAPQSPSAQPSLVPRSCGLPRSQSRSVVAGSTPSAVIVLSLSRKVMQSLIVARSGLQPGEVIARHQREGTQTAIHPAQRVADRRLDILDTRDQTMIDPHGSQHGERHLAALGEEFLVAGVATILGDDQGWQTKTHMAAQQVIGTGEQPEILDQRGGPPARQPGAGAKPDTRSLVSAAHIIDR